MPDGSEWSDEIEEIVDRFQSCFDDMERLELLFEYAEKHPSTLPMDL